MIRKIFFDINIVIDFLDSNRINHNNVIKIMKNIIQKDITIVISEDMLSTIYYIVNDKEKVLEFFKYIQNKWKIVSFGGDVINDAIEFSLKSGLDFEDLLQCFCSKNYSCDFILTSDKKFCDCGIKVIDIPVMLKELN